LVEDEAHRHFAGHCTVIRPGLIVGPGDETDRFSYWPLRVQRGGSVLTPPLADRVSFIDARDLATGQVRPIRIGGRCFIGGGSMILPGVTVGDEVIVAAGAVVTRDVPPRSIVAGNPARIIRSDIEVVRFGRLKSADEHALRQRQAGQVTPDSGPRPAP
jgi:nucleoside-diphosphate-sugar epimerase